MVEGLTEINLNLLDGVPFTATLLGILAAHGDHYLVARRCNWPTSPSVLHTHAISCRSVRHHGGRHHPQGAIRNKPPAGDRCSGAISRSARHDSVLLLGLHLDHRATAGRRRYWIEGNSIYSLR